MASYDPVIFFAAVSIRAAIAITIIVLGIILKKNFQRLIWVPSFKIPVILLVIQHFISKYCLLEVLVFLTHPNM